MGHRGTPEREQVITGTTEEPGLSFNETIWIADTNFIRNYYTYIQDLFVTKGKDTLLNVMSLEDLKIRLFDGSLHLWIAMDDNFEVDCIAIGALESHAYERNYHILWIGGANLKGHLLNAVRRLEEYAQLIGVRHVTLHKMRPGLARWMKKFGYKSDPTTVTKTFMRLEGNA